MAPIELDQKYSLLPVATAGGHVASVLFCTILIARTIYRSSLALPPSSSTRRRQPARKSHVTSFVVLALASLISALYWGISFSTLSYKVWATERGIALPESFFGDTGALRGGEHPGRLRLSQWLNDTPVYQDYLEIVAEKARRYWWGQQIDLASLSWGLMISIEGQRRNIPHIWAFMLISQLLSLSFAQNLFYVALLLTPVPLPENVKALTRSAMVGSSTRLSQLREKISKPKPSGWCPHPIIYLLPMLGALASTFLIPFASNTPSFATVSAISKAMIFVPSLLPSLVPQSWGTVHPHPHDAHSAYTKLYRVISLASLALHAKSTALALMYNTPDSHYHRHSLVHPFGIRAQSFERSKLDRYTTGIGKVLGSLNDHPAVSAVGWDVLLSAVSLGIWASKRGLNAQQILALSGLWSRSEKNSISNLTHNAVVGIQNEAEKIAEGVSDLVAKDVHSPLGSARKRTGRLRKSDVVDDEGHEEKPRRRIRSRKSMDSDSTYVPSQVAQNEGDESEEEDWEAGALTWGLTALFGLAVGSSGVFGAETTAR